MLSSIPTLLLLGACDDNKPLMKAGCLASIFKHIRFTKEEGLEVFIDVVDDRVAPQCHK